MDSSNNKAYDEYKTFLESTISEIKKEGTYKRERTITSPQYTTIHSEGKEVLNFCANNYLGKYDYLFSPTVLFINVFLKKNLK